MANPAPHQSDCIGPTTKALSGTVGVSTVINAAERTKGRHCCKVLVDLNKHGVSPFIFVFVMTPTTLRSKQVSATLTVVRVQYIRILRVLFGQLAAVLCSSWCDASKILRCILTPRIRPTDFLFGTKRTSRHAQPMSGFGGKADIHSPGPSGVLL